MANTPTGSAGALIRKKERRGRKKICRRGSTESPGERLWLSRTPLVRGRAPGAPQDRSTDASLTSDSQPGVLSRRTRRRIVVDWSEVADAPSRPVRPERRCC
ncbi:hypothetical protein MRX96_058515 [Rhipicephalus microplus]